MALEQVSPESRVTEYGNSVSWGGIFAGAFIALGIQLIFTLFGSAIGLSAFDPQQGDRLGSTGPVIFGIYMIITMIISMFVGGYAASRLAGFKYRMAAMLHGLGVWAVVTVFMTYALGNSLTNLVGGVFNVAQTAVTSAATAVAPSAGNVTERALRNNQQGGQAAGQPSPEQQAQSLKQQLEQIAPDLNINIQGQQAAGQVTTAAATSTWIAFITFLLSAIGAVLGGAAGAGSVSRGSTAHIPRKAA